MKKQTVKSLKKKVWTEFSKYIRMRDCLETTGCSSWGLCVTCGKRYHIKLLQAGHFIQGRNNAVLFDEEGVHIQCYNCNVNLKGNTLAYRDYMVFRYGEDFVKDMRENSKNVIKYSVPDLLEKLVYYKQQVKYLEKRT